MNCISTDELNIKSHEDNPCYIWKARVSLCTEVGVIDPALTGEVRRLTESQLAVLENVAKFGEL